MTATATTIEETFRAAIAEHFGLRFDDAKLEFLGELLQRRAAASGVPAARYLAHMRADGAEAAALAEELTIGETYFFRNGDQFRAFTEQVLPERMGCRGAARQLSFLSAGCSSGEEAFSLAMLIRDAVPSPPWDVTIRAVDLNPAALRKARSGRYGQWALRETPAPMRSRWFEPGGREMVLNSELRGMVSFDQRNLADAASDVWQPEAYDAIFCRNVIMYFTPATQHAVIARIAASLAPGGYLFLGHAETLRGLSNEFHLVHTHGTFYYQRRSPGETARHHQPVRTVPARREPAPADWPATDDATDTSWFDAIGAASRRIEKLARPATPEPSPAARWNLESVLDLLQRERFAEALQLIGRMPREASRDPDVLLLQALLLVQDGKLAAAADVSRVLLAQDEFNAAANYVLALSYEGSGDNTEAVRYYDIASHLDPNFAMPRLRRGLLARRERRTADARRDLEDALHLLRREDTSRLLLFGGGFTRSALSRLCESELRACGCDK